MPLHYKTLPIVGHTWTVSPIPSTEPPDALLISDALGELLGHHNRHILESAVCGWVMCTLSFLIRQ